MAHAPDPELLRSVLRMRVSTFTGLRSTSSAQNNQHYQ
jgi:hypothetical protein